MKKIFLLGLLLSSCASNPQRNIASQDPSSVEVVNSIIAKFGPVRDQGDTQLCAANAAADAITLHTGQRVSAFSVAIRNFQKRKGIDYLFFNPGGVIASQTSENSRFMLGLSASALKTSLDSLLCADDQNQRDLTYEDADLKSLWNSYQNFRSYIGPQRPDQLLRQIETELSKITPSLEAASFSKQASRYQSLDVALGKWFDQSCQIRMKSSADLKVVGYQYGTAGADELLRAIHQALDSGEIAVIHYSSNLLFGEEISVWESLVGFHVSSIVAKKQSQGQTYYLLRNSWGEACHRYARSISLRCDRGHIWLTEDEIRKSVTSVSYFSAK